MKRTLLPLVLGVLCLIPNTANAQGKPITLQSVRDRQRVLLVFSNGNNQLAEAQLTIAAEHIDGFRERDLLLVGIAGSNPALHSAVLSPAEDAAQRKRFHVAEGQFTVMLIGKDGGEKLRSHQPIPWETLRSTIDAMPMRQDEMQRAKP